MVGGVPLIVLKRQAWSLKALRVTADCGRGSASGRGAATHVERGRGGYAGIGRCARTTSAHFANDLGKYAPIGAAAITDATRGLLDGWRTPC
jgi:hypothetical protein